MCQKWFGKLCAGDFSVDDGPQSGRPVEVDSNQIETFIKNSQRYTTQEIADILKISKSIRFFVKMKNVSFILRKKPKWTFWPTQYISDMGPGLWIPCRAQRSVCPEQSEQGDEQQKM